MYTPLIQLYSGKANGYVPSVGIPPAREAIASYSSSSKLKYTADDVIVASGCSGALDLAITAMVDEGENLLVPQPGFPLYQVIVESLGGSVKHYKLKPDEEWECDLEHMDSLIDSKTRAILVTNPSNPTGSNYSAAHLEKVVSLAAKHNLPIIADEIYGNCVFEGSFTPIASLSGAVPVVSVGGLAKEFVVPGWRVGWILLHENAPGKRLDPVRTGIRALSQLVLGATNLIQAAIPSILTPEAGSTEHKQMAEFKSSYLALLRENAEICMEKSKECPQIECIRPTGAMYAMLKVDVDALDGISDEREFAGALLQEENIFMLPGSCFMMPNYLRMVTCAPRERLIEAFDRIIAFCARREKSKRSKPNGN